MSWLVGEHDDWLADAPGTAEPLGEAPVGAITIVPDEPQTSRQPLHSLPDAPTNVIRTCT